MSSPRLLNKRTHGIGRAPDFPRLLSGRLCLDFVNTIEGPISPEPEDFLIDYASLARWSWHAGAIDDEQWTELDQLASSSPEEARAVFARAVQVRGTLERLFRAIARGDAPARDDLEVLHAEHIDALRAASLQRHGGRMRWSWSSVNDLRLPLWLVVNSAFELLTDGDMTRIRQCPGADDCGWLFYDMSRNGTRRWCSMEGCGSRVKMRRLYERRRVSTAT